MLEGVRRRTPLATPFRVRQWSRWQSQADFETFRQVAEEGGPFPGQNSRQPMSHAHQNGVATGPALESALPNGMMRKHDLGAVGEFVRVSFRDLSAEIISRLGEDVPCPIQRT